MERRRQNSIGDRRRDSQQSRCGHRLSECHEKLGPTKRPYRARQGFAEGVGQPAQRPHRALQAIYGQPRLQEMAGKHGLQRNLSSGVRACCDTVLMLVKERVRLLQQQPGLSMDLTESRPIAFCPLCKHSVTHCWALRRVFQANEAGHGNEGTLCWDSTGDLKESHARTSVRLSSEGLWIVRPAKADTPSWRLGPKHLHLITT